MKKALFFVFNGVVILAAAVLVYVYWDPGKPDEKPAPPTLVPIKKPVGDPGREGELVRGYIRALRDARNPENPDQETDALKAVKLKERILGEISARPGEYLAHLEKENDREVVRFLVNSIRNTGKEEAFRGLAELFWKSPPEKKGMLLAAAGSMDAPGALDFLKSVFQKEKDLYLRRQALSLMSRLPGDRKEVFPVLRDTAENAAEKSIQRTAVGVMRSLESPEAAGYLENVVFSDKSPAIRSEALSAYFQMGLWESFDLHVRVLREVSDSGMKRKAIMSMTQKALDDQAGEEVISILSEYMDFEQDKRMLDFVKEQTGRIRRKMEESGEK